MARRKKDDVDKETLFISLHYGVDRALKTLAIHPAYGSLCDDLRNLLKLSLPYVTEYMKDRVIVTGTTEIEQ